MFLLLFCFVGSGDFGFCVSPLPTKTMLELHEGLKSIPGLYHWVPGGAVS